MSQVRRTEDVEVVPGGRGTLGPSRDGRERDRFGRRGGQIFTPKANSVSCLRWRFREECHRDFRTGTETCGSRVETDTPGKLGVVTVTQDESVLGDWPSR